MAKIKYILTLIITLCTIITYAQPAQYTPMTAAGYQMKRLKVDTTLHLPSFCGVPTLRGSLAKEGALAIDTCGKLLYMWTRSGGWDTINVSGGGGATDTTSLSNRINLKLNISDTASMLSKYLRKTDTISLSNRINLKLNISDTASMLNNYFNQVNYGITRAGKTISVDSATLSNKYLRIVDTTNKFVSSVTGLNDSTIRVIKGATTTDITIRSSATITDATRLITQVYNKSGATITKGSVIYINGAHSSNLPSIAKAIANSEQTSAYTYGLVVNDITNNNEGTVIQVGKIEGLSLPTSTYTDGDQLYLSPTVPGGYTLTKPLAPNHYVAIGTVTRAHPTNGSIQVNIRNGFQLDELSDVSIPAVPADSVILQFSRVDSLWHDVTINNAIGTRYLKPTDTVSLSNRINGKLTIADTSSLQRKSIPAYSILANPTSATANATAQAFRDTSGTYSGTITWTGTTAPSGATNHSYRLTQVGKCVTLHIALVFATNGSALTAVQMTLPTGAPTPVQPTGLTGSIFNMYPVNAQIVNTSNQAILASQIRGFLRNNTAANGFEIFLQFATASPGQVGAIVQYWTN